MSTVSNRRLQAWERFAPLAGVLAVVLWVVGVAFIESAGVPDEDAGGRVLAEHYDENSGAILAGAFIFMLGTALFVSFLGSLRTRIHCAEETAARIASVVFGTGILTAAMAMGFMAPEAAAAFGSDQIDGGLESGAAQALAVLGDGFFIAAEASVAVFFLAVGLAALRTRMLPAWLGWVGLVFAVAALFPWIGWAAFIWGLPLWVLVASILMFMRPAAPGGAETRPGDDPLAL